MIFLYRVEVVEMYQMRTRTTVLVPRGKCRLVFFDGLSSLWLEVELKSLVSSG